MRIDDTTGLSPRQEQAIAAMLSEQTLPKAAEAAGVNVRTLHRWLRLPEFAAAYRSARRETFAQAIALTQRYAALAVNTLAKVMMDPGSPTSAKVTAAVAVLRFGRDGVELEDLQVRVETLERQRAEEQADAERTAA